MQVLGLCRFSWPAIGGFQITHETPEERAGYLYSPARLEERFAYFESFALPSLRNQSDPDFTLLVVTGPDMPVAYAARLRALLATLPQAVLQVYPPGQHRAVMQKAINSVRRWDKRRCIQFRIDDDDAVNLRFVERLRKIAADAAPFINQYPAVAVDFNRGHIARPGPDGIHAEAVQRSFWAPGLAMIAGPWNRQSVMNFNHARIWQTLPTLTLPEPDMFVRGLSPHNDSSFNKGENLTLLDAKGEALFRGAYGICADQVRARLCAAR